MKNILYPIGSALSFALALYGMVDGETLVAVTGLVCAFILGTQVASD